MTNKTVEQLTNTTKANVDALIESGNATISGIQELSKFYQELATRNAEKLTHSIQALVAVKSPSEFTKLQQKLIQEGVEAAVSDSRKIADLTTTVFNAAFNPVKKQIETLQNPPKK